MRFFLSCIAILFLLISCGEEQEDILKEETRELKKEIKSENSNSKEKDLHAKLSRRWKYNERTISESDDVMQFGDESSDMILRLEPNGFFMIYDSITNQNIIDKGIKRIEQRSSGQWDLLNDEVLILKNISSDTVIVDSLKIDKIDESNLVTETKQRNKITYFSID